MFFVWLCIGEGMLIICMLIVFISIIRFVYIQLVDKVEQVKMGIIPLAIAIADLITQEQIDDLQQQINEIVAQYKDVSDEVQQLSDDLQKIDLKDVVQKLKAMNQNLSQNLQTIASDQQTKIDIISQIDIKRMGTNPKNLLSDIMSVVNVVSTVFEVVEVMCATNPATIAISGIMLLLNSILGIFSLINNIKEISELEKQKAQLEEYYKSGGQFQQDCGSMATLSYQLMENFYFFTVGFRSLCNQLQANVNLLSLSDRMKTFDYQPYLKLLATNPFDQHFENQCWSTYKSFVSVQDYQLEEKVNASCRFLDDFEKNNDVVNKLQVVKNITGAFTADSDIGQKLAAASVQITKLTQLKQRVQSFFERRKALTGQDLIDFDKQILDELNDQASKMEQPQLSVAEVVSFYTTSFYGDDSTGQTLFGMNLADLYEKTELLSYLGGNDSFNIIFIPEPDNYHASLQALWLQRKQLLMEAYQKKYTQVKFEFKRLYMRMENEKFVVGDKNVTKLRYYYGIALRRQGQGIDEYYQQQADTLVENQNQMTLTEDKILKKEFQTQDLKTLCKSLCFFINGVAYPDRIVNIGITKEDIKFKAVLEWNKNRSVQPKMMGKLMKWSIGSEPAENNQGKVLFAGVPKGDDSLVVLSFK